MNRKTKTLIITIMTISIILGVTIFGLFLTDSALEADFTAKNLPPSMKYLFGTDWMGRNMIYRTIKGLSTSIIIGVVAATVSAIIAVTVGIMAGIMPKWVDNIIIWCIDLVMGIPHIVLLILISFAMGRGLKGLVVGIAVTHWPSLARLVRGEVLQLHNEQYIKLSKNLGKSNLYIMRKHILPHVFPQFIVGLILLFPHAILHEAAITFLGFGLSPEQPAVGIILSESMKYLSSGMWWLAVFPGAMLVGIVLLFDKLGDNLRRLIDPYSSQE